MNNEYYGVASTQMDDFLAHYGIKGMKWGVRKAIDSGSDRQLRRQYMKAQKKLKKLEKLGSNGSKYAKRAVAYGAGAAAAGSVAGFGPSKVSKAAIGVAGDVERGLGKVGQKVSAAVMRKSKNAKIRNAANAVFNASNSMILGGATTKHLTASRVGNAIDKWGRSTSVADKAKKGVTAASNAVRGIDVNNPALQKAALNANSKINDRIGKINNNTIARVGSGILGAGMAVAAGRNAYRAATAKKHAQQAKQFRAEMQKAFAGTKYANNIGSTSNVTAKSRKRRH